MTTAIKNKQNVIWAWFPVTLVTAIFCCVLWGSASPAIKIAYQLFQIPSDDTASRLVLAGARFAIAGVMTVFFGSIVSRKILVPKVSTFKYVCGLALVQTVGQYYFFFMALANTTGVRGSIINAAGNFLAILIAAYIFHLEKMTLKKMIGCVIGFLGIMMILGGNSSALMEGGALKLSGEGAMVGAAVFYAVSGCLIKIFSRHENPVVLSGYQFFVGGILLLVIGTLMGGKLVFYSAGCAWNLIYMGFISAAAYTLWGILLKHNPVSRVSILGFVNPVMGVFLSALFLGENKEAFSLIGLGALVLVSIGIIIVNTGNKPSNG